MSKKLVFSKVERLIYLVSLVLIFGLFLTSIARADDPNLIGWWKLNETSGDIVVNSSAYGSVLNGTRRWAPTWDSNGKIGGCLYFNGSGQWVRDVGGSTPNTLLNIQRQITIAFWFKGRRNPSISATWEAFIAKGDNAYRVSRSASGPTLHFGLNGTDLQWFDGTIDVNDTGLAEPEWHHVCATYNGSRASLYVDGVLDNALECTGQINATTDKLFFGANPNESNRQIQAYMDNIRLYNRAVKPAEIPYIMEESYPFSYDPTPAEGAIVLTTAPMLKWRPGDGTTSHKVYLDPDKAKVEARSGCQINALSTTDSSYPISTPLAKGMTYYWAIDEVGTTTYPGDTWSFFVASDNASRSVPYNGATLVYRRDELNQTFGSLDVLMSWTQGIGAEAHNVYLDNFSPPTTLRATLPVTDTNWAPSEASPPLTLEYGKKYFWRIDEVNSNTGTTPGDEWYFTTIDADVGLKGEYYNNTELTPPFVLKRKDLNINFDWGSKSPMAGVVNVDSFSVRWTGELEVPATDTYTFNIYAIGEDGIRFWVNDIQYINSWNSFDPYSAGNQPTINLVKGRVPIRLEFRETSWGASCKLFWKTPSMAEREVIPIGQFYQPVKAWSPNPQNGVTDARRDPKLSWRKGEGAATHDVYFGTDESKVTDANRTNPRGVLVSPGQDPCSYNPGILDFNTTYYWRVDEVNLVNSPPIWKGNIWSFTVDNFLAVDDFEDYNDTYNWIFNAWTGYEINNTGMTVGHLDAPYAETSSANVRSGYQSMYLTYDNDGTVNEGKPSFEKTGTLFYSEAEHQWTDAQDWTTYDVNTLTIWFKGISASVGSFTLGPPVKMTAAGADIWGTADEFHFAYKQLSGNGTITAKVVSLTNTDVWAKAGVMFRDSLQPGSTQAMVVVTPSSGVAFQRREIVDSASETIATTDPNITAPQWVRLIRNGNTFTAEYSANGNSWTSLGSVEMLMLADTYVGLALTSHDADETCTAEFSNVTNPGTGDWQSQDIGINSNIAEQLYVVVEDGTGGRAMVANTDPNATITSTWTPWNIPLTNFAPVNLKDIRKLIIGVGNPPPAEQKPGGSGTLYIDDIRLYLP